MPTFFSTYYTKNTLHITGKAKRQQTWPPVPTGIPLTKVPPHVPPTPTPLLVEKSGAGLSYIQEALQLFADADALSLVEFTTEGKKAPVTSTQEATSIVDDGGSLVFPFEKLTRYDALA